MAYLKGIEKRLKTVICDSLLRGDEDWRWDQSFVEDLGADSLDSVELVIDVENEFGVDMPDEAALKMRTPADVLAWLVAALDGGHKQPAGMLIVDDLQRTGEPDLQDKVVSLRVDDWHDVKCVVGSLMIACGAEEQVRCQWYGMAERVDLRNGVQ